MCLSPIHIKAKSSQYYDGTLRVSERLAYDVPCGKCDDCKRQKIDNYTIRCLCEYQKCNYKASFVTLTYSDQYLPQVVNRRDGVHDGYEWLVTPDLFKSSVWNKSHVQKFLKSLNEKIYYYIGTEKLGIQRLVTIEGRRRINPSWTVFIKNTPRPLKYIVTCERGSSDSYVADNGKVRFGTARPHYHAILLIQNPLLSVAELNKLVTETWKYGHTYNIQIGDPLTFQEDRNFVQSIQYVTKYVTKDLQDMSFDILYATHNDLLNHLPFTLCSNGLGIDLLNHLSDDDFVDCVANGYEIPSSNLTDRKVNIPQYNITKRTKQFHDLGTFVKERLHDGFIHLDDGFQPSFIPLVEKEYYLSHRVISEPNELGKRLALENLHRKATFYADTLQSLQSHPSSFTSFQSLSYSKIKDYLVEDLFTLSPDDLYLFITDELYYTSDQHDYFNSHYRTYLLVRDYLNTLKYKKNLEHEINYKNNLTKAITEKPSLFNRKPMNYGSTHIH